MSEKIWFGVDVSTIGVLGYINLLSIGDVMNVYILGATAISITLTVAHKIITLIRKKRSK